MRVAAELAVAPGERFKVEMRERVRLCAATRDAESSEQMFPDEVRRSAIAEVDARFAQMHRQQLAVHVGNVKQRKIAEDRRVVQLCARLRVARAGTEARACRYTEG
jgi:hypothetical protein